MSIRSIARSAGAALGVAAASVALLTAPAGSAHASSCSHTDPLSASNIVLDKDWGFGYHNKWVVGTIYLGYFGDSCRQTYAEINWNNVNGGPINGTLYVNDPFNAEDGKVSFNIPGGYKGFTTSGMVSIDNSPHGSGAFPYPKAFQAAVEIHFGNTCSTTMATAAHLFSTGGTSGSSDTTCYF